MKPFKIIPLFLLAIFFCQCKQEEVLPDAPIVNLGGEYWTRTNLDKLIFENFTKPYNIEVKYKWNPYETNFNRTLVPPSESQVVPVLRALYEAWMMPFEKLGGKTFLKDNPISKFVLIGSPEYQTDGTIVLGTAEGGTKVTINNVNEFILDNEASLAEMLTIIHHEYTHILNQTFVYPVEWQRISTRWYTPTWFNTNQVGANQQGLITPYAKASAKEDFAETVAFLLVRGQDTYDWIKDQYPDAAPIFKLKQDIVEKYFKDAFGINFKELQREIQRALSNLFFSSRP